MRFVVPVDARSWVEVAPDSHFPIQNLPYCRAEVGEAVRHCVRIGDFLLDLDSVGHSDPVSDFGAARRAAYEALRAEGDARPSLIPVAESTLLLPMEPRAFVDFYSGINHASNVGRMFRPDQPPLLPNYRHLPVGYNGRASTVFLSGKDVRRPNGQQKIGEDVVFGPTKELDFELELGFFLSKGNGEGDPIPVGHCEDSMLGFVLVNDWSARDVQRWEYQPLGPFLAKSFATSVSPYVVSPDALEPFRVAGPPQEPAPLPHLRQPGVGHFNIELEVTLQTHKMKKPQTICRTNSRELYWSFAQQLAHQTSNGTKVEPGDLYASGTISGSEPGTFGSLLELTWRGSQPLTMEETGETRTFLEDGDRLTMTGWCEGDDYRIGFGEVGAIVVPAGE